MGPSSARRSHHKFSKRGPQLSVGESEQAWVHGGAAELERKCHGIYNERDRPGSNAQTHHQHHHMRDPANQIRSDDERNAFGRAIVFAKQLHAWTNDGHDAENTLGLVGRNTVHQRICRHNDNGGHEEAAHSHENRVAFNVVRATHAAVHGRRLRLPTHRGKKGGRDGVEPNASDDYYGCLGGCKCLVLERISDGEKALHAHRTQIPGHRCQADQIHRGNEDALRHRFERKRLQEEGHVDGHHHGNNRDVCGAQADDKIVANGPEASIQKYGKHYYAVCNERSHDDGNVEKRHSQRVRTAALEGQRRRVCCVDAHRAV